MKLYLKEEVNMNNRQIETSREIRLWVTGIVGPVLIGAATILASNPDMLQDVKKGVSRKIKDFKNGRQKEETL